jgi:hypothetical protein
MFARKIALALASTLSSVALAATFTPAANAATAEEGFFVPSRNIFCGFSGSDTLRCHISSGLKPLPAKPADCNLDWGNDIVLRRNGTVEVACVGDTIAGNYATIAYNRPWQSNGFRCQATTSGLTCRASNGKGFFLSRERWRRV